MPNRRFKPIHGLGAAIFIVAAALLMRLGLHGHHAPRPQPPRSAAADSRLSARDEADFTHSDAGFESPALMREHYAKHGHEFGNVSIDQYLHMAQDLRDKRAGGDIVESHEPGGNTVRFDRLTGSFIAFDSHGVIHTFFRPADGEAYYRRKVNGSAN